eukprot:CAMPEP_0202979530 /NCGR_PEP_ID=MMETSP1396-20130829/85651_1 /ASSEMBLY_ACC=CAM_ASM_000872 /TAXON_ID= /ORGANISM="Pseudokeronopsis sp., Strain Brazil" /LENGTH=91 /DNA_ID=CAMNT_0049718987 /DNA_START=410 /DNA_END=685 /DNA_ORIENTATION=-
MGNYKVEKPKAAKEEEPAKTSKKGKGKKSHLEEDFKLAEEEEEKEQGRKKKKNNTMKLYNQMMDQREVNKISNEKEKSLKHRWINATSAFN